jgi:hypothetical protein
MNIDKTKAIYYTIFAVIIILIVVIAALAFIDWVNNINIQPITTTTKWTTESNTPISSVGFISWPFIVIWVAVMALILTTIFTIVHLIYTILTSWLMGKEFLWREYWKD